MVMVLVALVVIPPTVTAVVSAFPFVQMHSHSTYFPSPGVVKLDPPAPKLSASAAFSET